jgi:hypothetical protein
MDPVFRAGMDDRADVHRPGRRPWIRAGLRSEADLVHRLGDRRDLCGIGLCSEVHDALARQAGHRRAADVLDPQLRSAGVDDRRDAGRDLDDSRIPRLDPDGPALVWPDPALG